MLTNALWPALGAACGAALGGLLSVWIEALLGRRPVAAAGGAGERREGPGNRLLRHPTVRHAALAAVCGVLAAGIWRQFGPDARAVWYLLLATLGVGLAMTDLRRRLLPNVMVSALAALALAGCLLGLSSLPLSDALLGAAAGFMLIAVPAFVGPRFFGAGDAKLAAALGLLLGYPWILFALYSALVFGGALAAVLLATRRMRRGDPFPFGPCLLAGALTAALWGPELFGWYLHAFDAQG